MATATHTIETLTQQEYQYGFVTDIEVDVVPRGLNEDLVRLISAKKSEPSFMREWPSPITISRRTPARR